ncbi:hypothetical protein E5N77_15185 [Streptomyces sp. SS52]|nr:hypothetical protein E5N77_15185 [Streptomyces sp. SS52]
MSQPGVAGCLPHSRLRSSGRCPHRPPVPPQRHDCPQLRGDGRSWVGNCPRLRQRRQLRWDVRVAAYGGEGACRGVSARSGWRVRAVQICGRPIPRRSEDGHPPARPRPTDNRTRYAHPHRTRTGAAGTPTTHPRRPPQTPHPQPAQAAADTPPTHPHRPPQVPPPNRRRHPRSTAGGRGGAVQ